MTCESVDPPYSPAGCTPHCLRNPTISHLHSQLRDGRTSKIIVPHSSPKHVKCTTEHIAFSLLFANVLPQRLNRVSAVTYTYSLQAPTAYSTIVHSSNFLPQAYNSAQPTTTTIPVHSHHNTSNRRRKPGGGMAQNERGMGTRATQYTQQEHKTAGRKWKTSFLHPKESRRLHAAQLSRKKQKKKRKKLQKKHTHKKKNIRSTPTQQNNTAIRDIPLARLKRKARLKRNTKPHISWRQREPNATPATPNDITSRAPPNRAQKTPPVPLPSTLYFRSVPFRIS